MLRDCENNPDRIGAISMAQCFKTQTGISSSILALVVSSYISKS